MVVLVEGVHCPTCGPVIIDADPKDGWRPTTGKCPKCLRQLEWVWNPGLMVMVLPDSIKSVTSIYTEPF